LMKSRWHPETSALVERLSDRPWISEELGIVDRARFLKAFEGEGKLQLRSAVDVSLTLLVEVWLRTQRPV